jgi:hypothetical protein
MAGLGGRSDWVEEAILISRGKVCFFECFGFIDGYGFERNRAGPKAECLVKVRPACSLNVLLKLAAFR